MQSHLIKDNLWWLLLVRLSFAVYFDDRPSALTTFQKKRCSYFQLSYNPNFPTFSGVHSGELSEQRLCWIAEAK